MMAAIEFTAIPVTRTLQKELTNRKLEKDSYSKYIWKLIDYWDGKYDKSVHDNMKGLEEKEKKISK